MYRTSKTLTALAVILSAVAQCVAQHETTTVTVRLFNRSKVDASVLMAGESQARELLRRAWIDVDWLNCQQGTQGCGERPSATNLILTILKHGSAIGGEDTLGLALEDAGRSGGYGYVFEDKLNELSAKMHIVPSRLLGYAMAHEIGHLLKGPHSHTTKGIMSACWSQQQLQEIAQGALEFTPQDTYAIHSRLRELNGVKQTIAKLDGSR